MTKQNIVTALDTSHDFGMVTELQFQNDEHRTNGMFLPARLFSRRGHMHVPAYSVPKLIVVAPFTSVRGRDRL